MFDTELSHSPHGATKGVVSAPLDSFNLSQFSGTEGPEIANQLSTAIKITLGQMNSLQFLTTPLDSLLAQIPTPRTESAKFRSYEMEDKILERWNKAYWTVRGFFRTGSPAAEQMKICDETANLPELWRIFNVNYVAAANFSGLFSLFYQLTGPTYVQKNLLTEFVRQNDLQKRIIQLKQQPNLNFTGTPAKNLFQSPFLRRSLDMSTPKSQNTVSTEPSEGGDSVSSDENDISSKQTESDKPRLFEGEDEWRRVMSTLFNMVNQEEHGSVVQEFIKERLLRGETEQSVFDLTEQKTYASLKLFLEFRQTPQSNFKTMATSVKTPETSHSCGQSECSKQKRKHTAESCWILHPELRPKLCDQIECQQKRLRHSAKKCWMLHPELKSHKANSSSQSEEEDDDEDDEEDEGDK